jgi:Beta2-adaptin appendage, C-terminal sub-domain
MAKANIATMASGGAGGVYKFYLHAVAPPAAGRVLLEIIVNKADASAAVTVKAQDAGLGSDVEALVLDLLATFGAQ